MLRAVAALALLTLPLAAALDVDSGPAAASVDVERTERCPLGQDGACVASWDAGDDPGPADDRVNATRAMGNATVSARAPVAQRQEVAVDPRETVVAHPVNPALEGAWHDANDSRPGILSPHVEFRSTSRLLILALRFPIPLWSPIHEDLWRESYVPVYSWDCGWYFTNYSNWDQACTYGSLRPLPNGLRSTETTDGITTLPADFLRCEDYDSFAPETCPAMEAGAAAGGAAADAWMNATPEVSFGAGVDRVRAVVEPRAWTDPARPAPGVTDGRPFTSDVATPTGRAKARETAEWSPRAAAPSDAFGPFPPSAPPLTMENKPPTRPPAQDPGRLPLLMGITAAAAGFLALLAAALYHRITRVRAFENANRQRVFELIREAPGTRAGTIARKLGLSHATVAGHLRVLERFGFVEAAGDGQRRYFVAGDASPSDKNAALASSSPIARAILAHLRQHGRADFSSICNATGVARSTASVTITRLEAHGVVVKRRERGMVWVEPAPVPDARARQSTA